MTGESDDKECSHCHRSKPRSDFYRNASKADGLQPWCKKCVLEHRANPNRAQRERAQLRREEIQLHRMLDIVALAFEHPLPETHYACLEYNVRVIPEAQAHGKETRFCAGCDGRADVDGERYCVWGMTVAERAQGITTAVRSQRQRMATTLGLTDCRTSNPERSERRDHAERT